MDENCNIQEDNTYVLHGPSPSGSISQELLGKDILTSLLSRPKGKLAMIDAFTRETLLYSQFLQKCVNLATALHALGYQGQGTVIAICSENCLDYFIPIFAALLNGSISAPVSHFYTPYELQHVLGISNPKLVFCSAGVLDKFRQLKRTTTSSIERIVLFGNETHDSVENLDKFIENVLKGKIVDPKTFHPAEGRPENTVSLIFCSSGTTGLPKGVVLSHRCLSISFLHFLDEITVTENQLGLLPFFHAFGHIVSFRHLLSGYTIIFMKRFDEDVFLRSIQDYGLDTLMISPPMALFLAKSDKVLRYDLSTVKHVLCGAAPLSKDLEEEVKRRLNCEDMRQGYGLTETTLAVTMIRQGDQRPGSCGTLVNYMSGKVRDPATGRSLGPRQIGEFCWKGPLVMMGYYGNKQATKETFTSDGWLKSGDMGYYDEDGYFYVVDRMKELIKYNAFQVAPAELEAILINHPKISDAGVVGLPDRNAGELPLAFVVKKNDELTEKEVQEYIQGLVSPHKRLRGGVIFVESIPKNLSGKILRRQLREILKRHKTSIRSKL
ncbi:luciferin 4-monooxygenase-like [Euwallacea fornicatus]|uniref:luciferin 4-monooxygenase-like n=1 Tax=Euwallacea fornicatus TaxID=995702 RepID=UPI00338ECD86